MEEILRRILLKRNDLTRETLLTLIRAKRDSVGSFLSDEGAAYMVAQELEVQIHDEQTQRLFTKIKDLINGLDDVSTVGRVLTRYPQQTFSSVSGALVKTLRALIADETGVLTAVLWGERVDEFLEKGVAPNQVVRLLHGYTREGLDGKVEFHLGERGEIVAHRGCGEDDALMSIPFPFKRAAQLSAGEKDVCIEGVVTKISPVTAFERDGRLGKVIRLSLMDETGEATMVLWGERVDEVGSVERGCHLRVFGGTVRLGRGNKPEVHVDRRGRVEILEGKAVLPPPTRTKIGQLLPDVENIDILTRVIALSSIREFKASTGKVGKVASILIGDETGVTRLTLWGELADAVSKMNVGNVILVTSAYTRRGLAGTELHVGDSGSLLLNPDVPTESIPAPAEKVTEVSRLKEGDNYVTVEGVVTETPTVKTVMTPRGKTVDVASFTLKDSTGAVKVSAWRDLARRAKHLSVGMKVRVGNTHTRLGLDGKLEVSTGTFSSITILGKN